MKYHDEAKVLWQTYVPPSGQADTVQGELIRAVEKCRDETQRNGNVNWDDGHRILGEFVGTTLLGSRVFGSRFLGSAARREIKADVEAVLAWELDDEPYDRLTDRIVEWSRAHPEPVPHPHNPDLHR